MAKAERESLQGELCYVATALNLSQLGPRGKCRGDRDPQPDNGAVCTDGFSAAREASWEGEVPRKPRFSSRGPDSCARPTAACLEPRLPAEDARARGVEVRELPL